MNGIDEELWNCILDDVRPPAVVPNIGNSSTNHNVNEKSERLLKNEKKFMRELRGALPLVVYNYVRSCKSAKEIWDTLKEKYQGSEKTKINSVKHCLVELREFKQKESESIELYYDRLNELIYKCNRYGITRSTMEFNLIFIMGLRKEWMNVKAEVNEISKESKISIGGPLALVSKISGREAKKESVEKENSEDEGLIVNSDDEAIAFYSNNRVKRFFKKSFNAKSKTTDGKGNFATKTVSEEKKMEKKEVRIDEEKKEKRLKGDSGFDYHYCNGSNHMENDCMLSKRDEKKSKIKDEAYDVEKLEEVHAKAKGLSLVAKGMDEDEGTYQISSSGSDDEEAQNPTHGAMFAMHEDEEEEKINGKCFVSTSYHQ
ncbi:hypothetical protein Lser_V15G06614 [Lactuca serriola]